MKYTATARLYALMFDRILKGYFREHLPERLAGFPELKRRVDVEFRAMVERTPGIGGASLEADLVGACWFFALAKSDPDMTPGLMDAIIDAGIKSPFMQRAHAGKRRRGTLFSDKVQDKKAREATASQVSDYEMGWRFTYEKGAGEFRCTYTRCGICTLARRENVERFLPCMCRMDYGTYEMVGAELFRTKTLAAGDECCDFHVVRKA